MENNNQQQPESLPSSILWATWNGPKILGLIITLQMAGFILQGVIFQSGLPMFPAVGLGTFLGILVPVFLLSRQPGMSLSRDFGLVPISLKTVVLSGAMAGASLLPMSVLGALSVRLSTPDPQWIQAMTENLPRNRVELLLALVTVSIMAPLAEEIIFRGLLFRLVRRTWGIPHAFAISSLVFAIVHFQPWFLLGLVGVGLLLAYVYQATGSALAAAVSHMVYNAISLIQMTYQEEPFAVDAPIEMNLILMAGISLVAMIFIGRALRVSP
jgi:membrane protease YdiL (CAAX protease family)